MTAFSAFYYKAHWYVNGPNGYLMNGGKAIKFDSFVTAWSVADHHNYSTR